MIIKKKSIFFLCKNIIKLIIIYIYIYYMNITYIIIGIIIGLCINYFLNKNNNFQNQHDKSIIKLLRQTYRWALASSQDKSPIVSLLHANYAAGFWWALIDIASDKDIERIGKINVKETEKKITAMQDLATKRVSDVCPQFLSHIDTFFANIAGNQL